MPIYKTASSAWGTWSSSPTATQDGEVGTAASPTTNFTGSAQITLGSLAITSEYTPASLDVSVTGGVSTQITSRSVGYAGYSVYIANGKTFSMGALEFNHSVVASHNVYVGAGATLSGGMRSATANTNTVFKEGPGLWVSGFGTTNYISTLFINGGTLRSTAGTNFAIAPTGTININNGAAFSIYSTRTYSNPIAVGSNGGVIEVGSGFTGTFSGAFSGSGTLTKSDAGTLSVTTSSLGMPVNITGGTLSMASGLNLTGSTLSGTGTLALAGAATSTVSNTAPNFTGAITGLFNYSAGARATVKTMGGNIAGTVRIPAGTITFTNPSNSGYLEIIDDADVTLQNSFFTGSGNDGLTGSWVFLRGSGITNIRAVVRLAGSGAGCAYGRYWAIRNNAHIYLTGGATLGTAGYYSDVKAPSTPNSYLISEDTSTNTFNGEVITATGTAVDPARVNFTCRTGGTFIVTGTLYAASPAVSTGDAEFTFNTVTPQPTGTSAPPADYQGTIRWTGTCLGSVATLRVGRGTLQINRATATGLAGGLIVESGATLAGVTPNTAYAAQLTGNVTLNAGAIMKFAAA